MLVHLHLKIDMLCQSLIEGYCSLGKPGPRKVSQDNMNSCLAPGCLFKMLMLVFWLVMSSLFALTLDNCVLQVTAIKHRYNK